MKIIQKFLTQLKLLALPQPEEKQLKLNPLYPIKPPYNSGFSEKHLDNFLNQKSTVIYYQNGGGGECDVISLEKTENLTEKNRQNFKNLTKQSQFEMLYNYMKSKSDSDIYTKEGDRKIAGYFQCGKDLINQRFKDLLTIGWISEIVEMNRKYKLLREEKS
jgi:hypothetical protein